jgi:hypothetical protein
MDAVIFRRGDLGADDAVCDFENSSHTADRWAALRGKDALNTQKNPAKAYCWFHAAAVQNNAQAEAVLATMYHEGNGVEKNYSEAFAWAKRSAEQNNYVGLRVLSLIYQRGDGTPADAAKAEVLKQQAAKLVPPPNVDMWSMLLDNPGPTGLTGRELIQALLDGAKVFYDASKQACAENKYSDVECSSKGLEGGYHTGRIH